MEPLKTSRRLLTWLYVVPVEKSSSNWKKWACLMVGVGAYVATMSFLASSMAFFMKFVSIDLEQSLYALFQIGGFSNSAYVITLAYFSHRKIVAIFDNLSAIYNARKNLINYSHFPQFSIIFPVWIRRKRFFVPIFGGSKQKQRMGLGNLFKIQCGITH